MLKNSLVVLLLLALIGLIAWRFSDLLEAGQYQYIQQQAKPAVQQKKWAAAVQVYENGLKQYPQNASIMTALAKTYSRLDNKNKAEVYYRRALKQKPNSKLALLNLILLIHYDNPSRFSESVGLLKKAFEEYDDDIDVLNTAGHLYLNRGKALPQNNTEKRFFAFTRAEKYYEQSLKKNPTQFVILFQLASLHQQMGHTRLGVKFYCKALALNEDHLAARYNLSLLMQRLQYYQQAYLHLNRVIKLAHQSNHVAQAQKMTLQAQALKRKVSRQPKKATQPTDFMPQSCLMKQI